MEAEPSIWLIDLLNQLPSSTTFDGLDVSFEALPPPETLPPNITLRTCNIMSEISSDLVGVYDIVHIRNFAFVLKDDDVKYAIDNIFKLLSMSAPLYSWKEIGNPQYTRSAKDTTD
jgi:hypothetical protein